MMTPKTEIDFRGLNCPLPVSRINEAASPLRRGDVLKVVATDPGSVADMAAFCRRVGLRILDQSEGGGEYVFYVQKA